MIQDVFKLKKDSWHMRLMTRIWGYDHYDFSNMCPYFWLSVLNVIIAPVFFLFVLFLPLIIKIKEIIEENAKQRRIACREAEQKWIEDIIKKVRENPSDPIVDKIARSYYNWDKDKRYNKKYRQFFYYFHLEPNLHEKYEKIREEEKLKKEQKKTKRQEIGQYTVKIKYAAKLVGIALLLFAGYWLVKLLIFLATLNWGTILIAALKYTGVTLLIFLGGVFVVAALRAIYDGIKLLWCKFGDYCVPCSDRREKIGNFFVMMFKGITAPFIWTGRGIFKLFIVLKALKDNNCPAIEWEE